MTLPSIVSAQDLDQALSRSPAVVVHFWADWCEPCKQMDTVLAQLAQENPHAAFYRIEAEAQSDLAEKYDVETVPFFVFFKNGAVVDKVEGVNTPELVAKVNLHVKTAQTAPAVKQKAPATPSLDQRIEKLLKSKDVLLFMKGDRDAPQCGFSSRVVSALQETGIPFETFDILSNPEIRQGLKEFSNWPTYPQLYAKGEFIGGCDIIEELHAEGELKETLEDALGGPGPAPSPPAPPAATPVVAAAPTKDDLNKRIASIIASNPVMLFMKGNPDAPRCGFSSKVVAALKETELPFGHFDVLSDDAVRQGVKEYANWPTFPQLYAGNELLGGCDIILEMHESGELKPAIQEMISA